MHRTDFGVFKSNVCHSVKEKGDICFLIDTLKSDNVRKLYNRQWYPEAFYLLGMIDYLSRINNVPQCNNYNDIRCYKLRELIYPIGVLLEDKILGTTIEKETALKNAIPEFLSFNIVECEIRYVC